MKHKYEELKGRLVEINDLESAAAVLLWDQQTYMPSGGAIARSRQVGTLARLAHEKLSDKAMGHLLDALRPYEESLPSESDEASLIRVARCDFEKARAVPPSFLAELSAHAASTFQVWTEARPTNNWLAVEPYLQRTLDLSRELADFFPGYEHIADPLIDFYTPIRPWSDPGVKASRVRQIFGELRKQLVPMVRKIVAQPAPDDAFLHQRFPEAEQWAFGVDVVKQFGYDFTRGRLDKTHHPFTTRFALGDVRITTRVDEYQFAKALFATMHEAGHAIYEQGVSPTLDATPVGQGRGCVHESQSRLWENLIGRSWNFWTYFYPKLQSLFPGQLEGVSQHAFYRAINKVQPSTIRIQADEVTYNLHPMLRFDLELQMLEGKLAVRDLPEAWRARYEADLGITPPTDHDGVMQDVHWYSGFIGGAFQVYTLGNLLSVQFLETAMNAHPEIPTEIANGHFETLLNWYRHNIHQYGRKFLMDELVERATGHALTPEPYLRYLRKKYGELYQIEL